MIQNNLTESFALCSYDRTNTNPFVKYDFGTLHINGQAKHLDPQDIEEYGELGGGEGGGRLHDKV